MKNGNNLTNRIDGECRNAWQKHATLAGGGCLSDLRLQVETCLTWQVKECQCNALQLQEATRELGKQTRSGCAESELHYADALLEEQNESRLTKGGSLNIEND